MDICKIVGKYFYFLLILLELEIAASTESQNLVGCSNIHMFVQRGPSVLSVILLNSELLSEPFYGVILSDLVLKYSFEN